MRIASSARSSAASVLPSSIRAGTPSRFRPSKGASPLEVVRREVRLGSSFSAAEFERAFRGFVQTYNVAPSVGCCAPDVLRRYCEVFERDADAAVHRTVSHRGVPLRAAVVAAGTVAFEGEVDEDRMGDW